MPRYNGRSSLTAKHTCIGDIKFDSQQEARCYELLKRIDSDIKCQVSIDLLPSKLGMPARNWRCDFYSPKYRKYIEYKGVFDREFRGILQLLGDRNPFVWKNLVVISTSARTEASLKKFSEQLKVARVSLNSHLELRNLLL